MKNISFLIFLLFSIKCTHKEECNDTAICVNPKCFTNCSLNPEVGQCNGAFPKYYFNKQTMKCDSFIWGGCNGIVPFETFEECSACGCK